jgi:hypothetical protein
MVLFDFLKGSKTKQPEYDYLEDDEDDEDSEEYISVWDAAQIWACSGMDEDNTFGYTEVELRNAL